jgi:hypothetical protein
MGRALKRNRCQFFGVGGTQVSRPLGTDIFYKDIFMTTSSFFEAFPGLMALSPEGKCVAFSRSIYELQGTLAGRLPALTTDYVVDQAARGAWFCLISYLLERGVTFYCTSESVIRTLETKTRGVSLAVCDASRRIWVAGEEWSEPTFTIEELNAELVAMAEAEEKDQVLPGALVVRL